ncbi:ankyrin repeat domain-containing protein [Teredinibacter turnerae]|uniref:ankyrin repeat domain-containing protein n=1 Tax=Teredinibacter turnerae TaxID=2426 RepID=UPI00036024B5|nr:ankyrin repeat domain-containing protein [Teredinibacter turnerae]
MTNSKNDRVKEILREYSGLPEYSEMPIPKVNDKSLFGDYPINIAATRGLIEEISVLRGNGADINANGEHGYTPLHDAVEQGHMEVVKFLVDLGANIAIRNADGDTPIELAKLLNETEIHSFLDSLSSSL